MVQISLGFVRQKHIPEYYVSVHLLHPAYRLINFVTGAAEISYPQYSSPVVSYIICFVKVKPTCFVKEIEASGFKEKAVP